VTANDTVSKLLKLLKSTNVSGAIVLKDIPSHDVRGFVDVLDIANLIIKEANLPGLPFFTNTDKEYLLTIGHRIAQQSCASILNLSGRDPMYKISLDDTAWDSLKFLNEAHRVAVTNTDGIVVNVLAQMDIVNLLLSRYTFSGSNLEKPFLEAGLTPNSVVGSLDENVNVMGALRYMRDCGISGVAIINKAGKLITNLSASDFLGLTEENFDYLTLTIGDFLQRVHGFLKPPVYCRSHDTIETILLKLQLHKVHRIYICDQNLKPTGFLSLTDIIQFLGATKEST